MSDYVVEVNAIEWGNLCDSKMMQVIVKDKLVKTYYKNGNYILAPKVREIPEILNISNGFRLSEVELKVMEAFKLIYNAN